MSADLPTGLPANLPDAALWQRSRMIDAAVEEAERYLDLAGFADSRLDPDDRERVAEWLAGDSEAAADVAAARALAAVGEGSEGPPESSVARAAALVGPAALVDPGERQPGVIIPFALRHRARPRLHSMARWGSLVAAMAVASWLGFALGMDTSLSLGQSGARSGQAGEDGFLSELLDPSTGFMRELTEGNQT